MKTLLHASEYSFSGGHLLLGQGPFCLEREYLGHWMTVLGDNNPRPLFDVFEVFGEVLIDLPNGNSCFHGPSVERSTELYKSLLGPVWVSFRHGARRKTGWINDVEILIK